MTKESAVRVNAVARELKSAVALLNRAEALAQTAGLELAAAGIRHNRAGLKDVEAAYAADFRRAERVLREGMQ